MSGEQIGIMAVFVYQQAKCGCLGWDQGGWKDSRKVPHAALMHDGQC